MQDLIDSFLVQYLGYTLGRDDCPDLEITKTLLISILDNFSPILAVHNLTILLKW
jgi:hypothetical protein